MDNLSQPHDESQKCYFILTIAQKMAEPRPTKVEDYRARGRQTLLLESSPALLAPLLSPSLKPHRKVENRPATAACMKLKQNEYFSPCEVQHNMWPANQHPCRRKKTTQNWHNLRNPRPTSARLPPSLPFPSLHPSDESTISWVTGGSPHLLWLKDPKSSRADYLWLSFVPKKK